MRLSMPMVLLMLLVQACPVGAQSVAPDNRYMLKAPGRYMTGFPYVPRTSKGEPSHVKGEVYLGINALRFRFCSEHPEGAPEPFAEGVASSVDKSLCEEHCGPKLCQEVRIPYDRMKLLARGRVVGMGGTSEDTQVASAGIGVAGLVAGVAAGGAAEKWLIGSAIGGVAIAFGAHELALKRANFITIFFTPATQTDSTLPCLNSSSPPAGTTSAEPAATGAAGKEPKKNSEAPPPRPINFFAEASGCNVTVLQIFSSHAYWDISMILNSRTGKEFVAQSAEQK